MSGHQIHRELHVTARDGRGDRDVLVAGDLQRTGYVAVEQQHVGL